MTSYQKPTVRCPLLLHLVAFAAVALLIPNPAYAQNLESQLAEASLSGDTEKVMTCPQERVHPLS